MGEHTQAKARVPWPIRLVMVIVFIELLLVASSWLILVSAVLDVDPKTGLSCDEAATAFSQMRHEVLCGFLHYHFPAYLRGNEQSFSIVPLDNPKKLIGIISVNLLVSDLLYLGAFLMAVSYHRMWFYLACSLVVAFYGISYHAISYSVLGGCALLALLHKPSRAYLLPD